MPAEIILTKSEFKAFSSDIRIQIVKLLQKRNHTLSELSKKINLSNPNIKQHLEKLVKAGIVKQIDEGRKWKYYSLTKKGKEILEPEEDRKILIILTVSFLALVGVMYLFIGALTMPMQATYGIERAPTLGIAEQVKTPTTGIEKADITPRIEDLTKQINLSEFYIYLTIIIIVSIILGYTIAKRKVIST